MSTGKGNVLLGILAGLAAGTILGILFAPEKGSETRRKVVDKGNDFAENVKKKFDDFIDGLVDKQEPIKEDH
jgi:gas vesicle protein